jgi:hypothetical protein
VALMGERRIKQAHVAQFPKQPQITPLQFQGLSHRIDS